MKFFRPSPRASTTSSSTTKPASFGQARAAQMEQRLQKARDERVKLTRAQYAAPDPLNKTFEEKGNVLDRQIKRLEGENSY